MNRYHDLHKNDSVYKAKNADRAKKWYRENREKALKRIKEHSRETKEQKSEYDKLYYRRNIAKKKSYYQEWSAKNPDKVLDNVRQWREANPLEHRLHNQARRAKTNGVKVIKEDIHNWQTRICGVCDKIIEGEFHIDHIIPLARDGRHEASNLQLTHPVCNLRKHIKLSEELVVV